MKRLRLVEQESGDFPVYNRPDEPIDRGEVGSRAFGCCWVLSRNDKVASCIELIAPKPGHQEGFFIESRAEEVVEATAYDEDARSAPSQRYNCRSLVSSVVNAGY